MPYIVETADVRMIQSSDRLGLPLEALPYLRVLGKLLG